MTAKRKPCDAAEYNGRGEWFCAKHKRGDPDNGCPPDKPKPTPPVPEESK